MGLSTLADFTATTARVNIPAWGRWYADVTIDGEHVLKGAVDLKIADLSLKGTILSGGPSNGHSLYRVVAGAGFWGKPLKKQGYANDAGVKVATVLGDAAAAVGENVGTIDPSLRLGPAWTRPAGPACTVLELVAPGAWYIDNAGVTQLGARATVPYVGQATRLAPVDKARRSVTIAAESIATLLPGAVIDGLLALDVMHEVSAKGAPAGGLKTTIWGTLGGALARSEEMSALLEQLDPDRRYRGVTEYRVESSDGKRLNLQPVQVSMGMPDLHRVPVRPGVPGCEAETADGARVLVGFVNSDPGRPYVAGFEDAEGDGFMPTTLTFLKGTLGVARMGDSISVNVVTTCPAGGGTGTGTGTITSASTKVKCG